jgi:hypothetical protein
MKIKHEYNNGRQRIQIIKKEKKDIYDIIFYYGHIFVALSRTQLHLPRTILLFE